MKYLRNFQNSEEYNNSEIVYPSINYIADANSIMIQKYPYIRSKYTFDHDIKDDYIGAFIGSDKFAVVKSMIVNGSETISINKYSKRIDKTSFKEVDKSILDLTNITITDNDIYQPKEDLFNMGLIQKYTLEFERPITNDDYIIYNYLYNGVIYSMILPFNDFLTIFSTTDNKNFEMIDDGFKESLTSMCFYVTSSLNENDIYYDENNGIIFLKESGLNNIIGCNRYCEIKEFNLNLTNTSEYDVQILANSNKELFMDNYYLTEIILPDTIDKIEQKMCFGCNNLLSITIPNSINYIDSYAFNGCPIEKIKIECDIPPKLDYSAFSSNVYDIAQIYVKKTSINLYKNTKFWGGFKNYQHKIDIQHNNEVYGYEQYIVAKYITTKPNETIKLVNNTDNLTMYVDHKLVDNSLSFTFVDAGEHIVVIEVNKDISSLKRLFFGSSIVSCYFNISINSITNISLMFAECFQLECADLSGLNTSNVVDMSDLFTRCVMLTNINMEGMDTSNCEQMYTMFAGCVNLKHIDVSSFNTQNVINMGSMFSHTRIKEIDISHFNTANVQKMYSMFAGCINLKHVDLSDLDLSNVDGYGDYYGFYSIFSGCISLESVKMNSNIKPSADVRRAFDGIKTNGVFYFNGSGYENMIQQLPSSWVSYEM